MASLPLILCPPLPPLWLLLQVGDRLLLYKDKDQNQVVTVVTRVGAVIGTAETILAAYSNSDKVCLGERGSSHDWREEK